VCLCVCVWCVCVYGCVCMCVCVCVLKLFNFIFKGTVYSNKVEYFFVQNFFIALCFFNFAISVCFTKYFYCYECSILFSSISLRTAETVVALYEISASPFFHALRKARKAMVLS